MLKSSTDPKGNSTTVTTGADGKVTEQTTSSTVGSTTINESYLSTYYSSGDNAGRLQNMTLRRQIGSGSWTTVRQTVYTYYDGTTSNGNLGDLQTVTTEDASSNKLDTTYYRYYTADTSSGFVHGLKYMVSPQSFGRLAAAVSDPLTATDTEVATYADQYYEYDSQHRASKVTLQGQGTFTYIYETSSNADDYNAWDKKTIETLPNGTQNISYFDYAGQMMLQVTRSLAASKTLSSLTHSTTTATATSTGHGYSVGDVVVVSGASQSVYNGTFAITAVTSDTFTYTLPSDPGASASGTITASKVLQQWGKFTKYDSAGRPIMSAQPSALALPDNLTTLEQYSDLLHSVSGNYEFLNDETGLIYDTDYYTSTSAGESTAGGVVGYLQHTKLQQGETGTAILQSNQNYFAHTAGGATVYPVASQTVYRNDNATGAETTSYSYTWFSGTTQESSQSVSKPIIGGGQNGPNIADVITTVFDGYGRPAWTRDADGFLAYTAYDQATGAVTKTITDVNTSNTSDFANLPTGWTTPSGGGLHLITTYQVDSLGRTTKTTSPAGNVTYNIYKDFTDDGTSAHDNQGAETRTYHWDTTADAEIGPTQVMREDRPGSYSEDLSMSATPHLTSGVPDGTESVSNLQTLARSLTNAQGQTTESNSYFNLGGVTYSTATAQLGTLNTNYYATTFGYDAGGRPDRSVSADRHHHPQRLRRLGAGVSTWVGTNDTPGQRRLVADEQHQPVEHGGAARIPSTTAAAWATAT